MVARRIFHPWGCVHSGWVVCREVGEGRAHDLVLLGSRDLLDGLGGGSSLGAHVSALDETTELCHTLAYVVTLDGWCGGKLTVSTIMPVIW